MPDRQPVLALGREGGVLGHAENVAVEPQRLLEVVGLDDQSQLAGGVRRSHDPLLVAGRRFREPWLPLEPLAPRHTQQLQSPRAVGPEGRGEPRQPLPPVLAEQVEAVHLYRPEARVGDALAVLATHGHVMLRPELRELGGAIEKLLDAAAWVSAQRPSRAGGTG